jgi:putative endonuclease
MTNTAGRTGTLYTGVTSDLVRRVFEHRTTRSDGFTTRYNLTRLVYTEEFPYVLDAIAREADQRLAAIQED